MKNLVVLLFFVILSLAVSKTASAQCKPAWTFGQATPHCKGTPVISGHGLPKLGTRFTVQVAKAMPAGDKVVSLLFIGGKQANIRLSCLSGPAKYFYVNIWPVPGLDMPMSVDTQGNARLTLTIPQLTILVGMEFYFQFAQAPVLSNCPECRFGFISLTGTKGLGIKICR